jgi:DNA-binding PadR family transcriptional regulator
MDAIPRVTGATLDVLQVLLRASAPTWGLQVIAATDRPAGSVYPILARLENRGWLISAWEEGDRRGPRRRLYSLTDEARPAARALLAERRVANGRLDWSMS